MTMPLIGVQARISRTGAIRLGHKVATGGTDKLGNPKTRPAKLDRFRVTSPLKTVVESVAGMFGGTCQPWQGPQGPEWEVVTESRELPILVPPQPIDPNYEFWGNRVKLRLCDGRTEMIRKTECLCQRWDNHQHKYWNGNCNICGVAEDWGGPPHEHRYEFGYCSTCGCRRPCKPTIRVSLMIRGIAPVGVFKLESHGINAAQDLPGFADIIAQTPIPLPGTLTMRYVDQSHVVVTDGGERTEARQFWVPQLVFPWLTPDMAYTGAAQLEQAARAQITAGTRTDQLAIESSDSGDPDDKRLRPDDVIRLAAEATNQAQVRQLWRDAATDKALTTEVQQVLTKRASELNGGDVVDAEIVDE
jgi:hypothetical protein